MADRNVARLGPPWVVVPVLFIALVVLTGATAGDEGSANGGIQLGGIALVLGGVVVGAALALAAVYLVLRWRAGPAPAEVPGEWWTCATCGAANIVGSPRCHACGAWPR